MLWPEKREHDSVLGDKVPGVDRPHHRRAATSRCRPAICPTALQPLQGRCTGWLPWLFSDGGDIEIGPIPAGHAGEPARQPRAAAGDRRPRRAGARTREGAASCCVRLKHDLKALPQARATRSCASASPTWCEPLLELSKCPDFVVNRGHYFGTASSTTGRPERRREGLRPEPELSDDDKRALIEFLKTLLSRRTRT